MTKRRLLIATDSFLPRLDGVSRFLSELIPYLKKDYKITVIAPNFLGGYYKENGVEVIRIKTFNFMFGDYTPPRYDGKTIKKYVQKNDIVWINSIGPIGWESSLYAKKYKKKSIGFVHSIDWDLWSKSLKNRFFQMVVYYLANIYARNIYNKLDLIIVPTNGVGSILESERIITKKYVANLGVDINNFKPAKDKRLAKKKIGIHPNLKVIGFCGRIAREKDLPTLYSAFKKLTKKRKDVLLLIVGSGITETDDIIDYSNVIFVGSKDDVKPYYQAMDIFVLPSLTETTSLSTMEAMATELAVVSTPVGDIKNYIHNNKNGILFNKGDSNALYRILTKLVNDKKFRNSLGKEARKTIIRNHRWINTVNQIKKIFKKL